MKKAIIFVMVLMVALLVVCGVAGAYETKLTASDGAAGNNFGYSVSVSGNVAIVGAYDDEIGTGSGSAYIYRWKGTSWVEEQKLTASDGAEGDYFGYSVSVSGNVAIVGAYFDDDKGDASGSAYIYGYTYGISPTKKDYDVTGGSGSVVVTADVWCDWTAVSNDDWIDITSGATGSGNGTVA